MSLAAGALCQWVHAMKIYAEIYREVEPKRNKLRQAQEKLESKQKQLREANAELKKVQDLVKNLNDQFNSSNNEKDTFSTALLALRSAGNVGSNSRRAQGEARACRLAEAKKSFQRAR